ncbi:hypothetical protein NECAME_01992 [Necator americanus]|uniref:Uncharacterized protein n=1 Tax=Necator americanus TaxID=51031 RepID=W2TJL1_NECAM|nr:hypothetical protein NECAME_01992 [Necator americanus]ETN82255.1 hypothetical protein NECAME_01992 [Necator americanus]
MDDGPFRILKEVNWSRLCRNLNQNKFSAMGNEQSDRMKSRRSLDANFLRQEIPKSWRIVFLGLIASWAEQKAAFFSVNSFEIYKVIVK